MYLISVIVGRSQPLVWGLLFTDENRALAALGRLREVGDVDVQDDHGQRLCAKGGDLGPIMMEDMALSKAASIEQTLHDQRIRVMCLTRMQADPAFKTAMMGQGPAILSPGMNGIGRG